MDAHEAQPDDQSNNHRYHDLTYHIGILLGCRFLSRLIGSLNRLQNRVDPGGHPARCITGAKPRDDLTSDNLRRSSIGQCAFQPIADFNTNLSFLHGDQEQDSVVGSFLTQLPRRRDTVGVGFERFPFEGWEHEHRDLVAGGLFVRLESHGE